MQYGCSKSGAGAAFGEVVGVCSFEPVLDEKTEAVFDRLFDAAGGGYSSFSGCVQRLRVVLYMVLYEGRYEVVRVA